MKDEAAKINGRREKKRFKKAGAMMGYQSNVSRNSNRRGTADENLKTQRGKITTL
jgi:hypothetical protein